jgi:hypothetical protein
MAEYVCWKCGTSLKAIPRPISRLAKCKVCEADLHVCRLCRFYNPRMLDRCDHEMAEPAREVDVANFCHYFRPRTDAYNAGEGARAKAAREQLKALFGEDEAGEADSEEVLSAENKQDEARKRLEDLFK